MPASPLARLLSWIASRLYVVSPAPLLVWPALIGVLLLAGVQGFFKVLGKGVLPKKPVIVRARYFSATVRYLAAGSLCVPRQPCSRVAMGCPCYAGGEEDPCRRWCLRVDRVNPRMDAPSHTHAHTPGLV